MIRRLDERDSSPFDIFNHPFYTLLIGAQVDGVMGDDPQRGDPLYNPIHGL
jgi:hypothetical protein